MHLKVKIKNTQYAYRDRYASYMHIPEFNTYIGQVVKPKPKWLKDYEFMITTGDYESPVRVLDKRDVVQAWVNRSKQKTNVHIVEDKYVVTQDIGDRFSCTCTAYHYRKRCSHIDNVKKGN